MPLEWDFCDALLLSHAVRDASLSLISASKASCYSIEEHSRVFCASTPCCCSNSFSSKVTVLDIHMAFSDSFDMFFRFLVEMRFRTIMKLHQKQVLEPKCAVFVPPSLRLT